MRILFIGDIFGAIGRDMISNHVMKIKQEQNIDIIIANAENAAHGKGITSRIYDELRLSGINIFTMGNHTYAKREIFDFIDEADRLVVPLNKSPKLPGVGSRLININGVNIRVTNLLGMTNMLAGTPNPFLVMEDLLKTCKDEIHIVDFHAEVTSEKIALGYFLDGKVTAVLGTHTHVPTADYRILEHGTAYISDVGMTGPLDGVIGCGKEGIIKRFVDGLPVKFEVASGKGQFNAVIIDIDNKTHKATHIERYSFIEDRA